jgi:hypothetical protein
MEEAAVITKPLSPLERIWLGAIGLYLLILFPLFTIIQPISVRYAVSRADVSVLDPLEIQDAFRLVDTDTGVRAVLSILAIWTGISVCKARLAPLKMMIWCLIVLIAYNVSFYPLMRLLANGSIAELVTGMAWRFLSIPVVFAAISTVYFRNRV